MKSHLIVHKKIQEQSTGDLIKCIKNIYLKTDIKVLNCEQNNPREVYKELFKRIIIPLYLPFLILVAAVNLLTSKENVNYFKYRIVIFLLGVLTIIISESSLGFLNNIFLNNLIFILLPIVFVLTLYLILFFKFKLNTSKV